MSRLRNFVDGAHVVAEIQTKIIDGLESVCSSEQEYRALESVILAPGYPGWESRMIEVIKSAVQSSFEDLNAHTKALNSRYKKAIADPGQDEEFWVDEKHKPHARIYWCLRCGYKVTSLALSGICCHGQPECPRCKHEVHEPNCRRKVGA